MERTLQYLVITCSVIITTSPPLRTSLPLPTSSTSLPTSSTSLPTSSTSPPLQSCSGKAINTFFYSVTLDSVPTAEGGKVYADTLVNFTCSVSIAPFKMFFCFMLENGTIAIFDTTRPMVVENGTVVFNATSPIAVDKIQTLSLTDIPSQLNKSYVSCIVEDFGGRKYKGGPLHFFFQGSGEGAGTTDSTTLPTTAAMTAGDVPTTPAATDAGPGTPNNTNIVHNKRENSYIWIIIIAVLLVAAAAIAMVMFVACLCWKLHQNRNSRNPSTAVRTQDTIITDEPLHDIDGGEKNEENKDKQKKEKFSESVKVEKDIPTDPILSRPNKVLRTLPPSKCERSVPLELDCTHQQEETSKNEIDEVAIDDISGDEEADGSTGDILNDMSPNSQLSGSSHGDRDEPGLGSGPEDRSDLEGKDCDSFVVSQCEEKLHALSERSTSDSLCPRDKMVVCATSIVPANRPEQPRDKPSMALPVMDGGGQEWNFPQCDSELFM